VVGAGIRWAARCDAGVGVGSRLSGSICPSSRSSHSRLVSPTPRTFPPMCSGRCAPGCARGGYSPAEWWAILAEAVPRVRSACGVFRQRRFLGETFVYGDRGPCRSAVPSDMPPRAGSVSAVWRRRADVLWRAAPEYLVVSTTDAQTIEFGGPASEIWQLLASPRSVAEMSFELAERFGAPPDLVRRDVEAFIAELEKRSLVEWAEPEQAQ
jgi:hypothetical protein